MKSIYREAKFRTPEIKFDPGNNSFSIIGRSLPEDANEFYQPYKDWLTTYFASPIEKTDFILQFDYFNSSSSRMLLEILYILRDSINNGNHINIIWRFEEDDDEMETVGEEIKAIIEVPVIMESIKVDDD